MNPGVVDGAADLGVWLLIWLAGIGVITTVQWRLRRPQVGLTFAFVVSLWLIHWLGGATYLFTEAAPDRVVTVAAGVRESGIAVLAFAFGSLFLAPILDRRPPVVQAPVRGRDDRAALRYVWCGVAFFLALSPQLARVPSLTAVVSTGQYLLLVGVCLLCYHAWHQRRVGRVWGLLAASLLLPVVTVVTRGFIGYGVYAMLVVFCFAASFYRPRWRMVAVGGLLVYGGLIVYGAYMQTRNDIRAAVWGGTSWGNRLAVLGATIDAISPLDPQDVTTIDAVDKRLNQNVLVGAAVEHLREDDQYAKGATLVEALLSPIPRLVWADKPVQAGSGHLVTDYTGIVFAVGTSVGIGQVLEFYINFGTPGVIGGFVLLGVIVAMVDWTAGRRLAAGDERGFALWFLAGLPLINVGGSLVEVTSGIAASVVVALFVNRVIVRQLGRPPRPRAEPVVTEEADDADVGELESAVR